MVVIFQAPFACLAHLRKVTSFNQLQPKETGLHLISGQLSGKLILQVFEYKPVFPLIPALDRLQFATSIGSFPKVDFGFAPTG